MTVLLELWGRREQREICTRARLEQFWCRELTINLGVNLRELLLCSREGLDQL
jgi:hypothetical protein